MKFKAIYLLSGWVICLGAGCGIGRQISLRDEVNDMQGMWVVESSVSAGKYGLFDEMVGKIVIVENQCFFWIEDWGVDSTLQHKRWGREERLLVPRPDIGLDMYDVVPLTPKRWGRLAYIKVANNQMSISLKLGAVENRSDFFDLPEGDLVVLRKVELQSECDCKMHVSQ